VVLSRPKQISTAAPVAARGADSTPLSTAELALVESLRVLRRAVAEELGVPPYVVFGDDTLNEMARVRPSCRESLVSVRGIGRVKLDQFGERFLDHIRTYAAAKGLALDAARGSRPRRDAGANATRTPRGRAASGAMFAAGRSIDEVAGALGIQRGTAAAHLSDYILTAKPASIDRWVDAAAYREVARAAAEVGTVLLRPIFERLGGAVEYEQIRLVVNHLSVVAPPAGGNRSASERPTLSPARD
jgi:ATP-dependent DNA helicase RecQ